MHMPELQALKTRPTSYTLRMINTMLLVLLSPVVFAQQTYVTRYDAYGGYAFLDSPHLGLFQNGFAAQIGFRPKTWYSVGFDYTIAAGDLNLTPDLLQPALRDRVAAQAAQLAAAGQIPPGFNLVLPVHSRTQTFAAGAQLAYRHFRQITLFLRPVFVGGVHETATARPRDPITAGFASQLVPSGQKSDTVPFIGFGGGFDIILSRHFSVRTQADLVYDHLFSDILKDGRFTTRFSIGPAFNFGRNIAKTPKTP